MGTKLSSPTDLAELFASLADEDFYQALDAARSFSGDAPRALAMISVARATFEKKTERASDTSARPR
jgi:hypothetical protein